MDAESTCIIPSHKHKAHSLIMLLNIYYAAALLFVQMLRKEHCHHWLHALYNSLTYHIIYNIVADSSHIPLHYMACTSTRYVDSNHQSYWYGPSC